MRSLRTRGQLILSAAMSAGNIRHMRLNESELPSNEDESDRPRQFLPNQEGPPTDMDDIWAEQSYGASQDETDTIGSIVSAVQSTLKHSRVSDSPKSFLDLDHHFAELVYKETQQLGTSDTNLTDEPWFSKEVSDHRVCCERTRKIINDSVGSLKFEPPISVKEDKEPLLWEEWKSTYAIPKSLIDKVSNISAPSTGGTGESTLTLRENERKRIRGLYMAGKDPRISLEKSAYDVLRKDQRERAASGKRYLNR